MTPDPAPNLTLTIDESTCDELIEVLGKVLDLRDNDTAGHSDRVRRYCLQTAEVIGCSRDELSQIARAASLHDIGKIAVPDSILRKNGKLTPQEWRVMESHVWVGFSLLRRVHFLREVAQIVLAHHERWDGTGYPCGLKDGGIPLAARIFAVADTLDAITSDRPYRSAQPLSAAREEILRESGRQFDPRVVEAFTSIPDTTLCQIMLEEKRHSARVPFQATVNCIQRGRRHTLKGVDISEGGLLLEEDDGLRLAEALQVEFELPRLGQSLKLEAEVVRRELPDKTAVAFRSLHPRAKESLQEFVGRVVGVTFGHIAELPRKDRPPSS